MVSYERMRPLLVIIPRAVGLYAKVNKNSSLKNYRALCTSTNFDRKDGKSTTPLTGDLRSERITFCVNSKNVTLDAVVQDTMPGGSKVGTVVAVHGALGSHKDYKHLVAPLRKAGIRLIGVNFPCFGYTQDVPELQHTNEERSDYVQAIVDKLGLDGKLVFLGHSRGTENAMRLAARNVDRCAGVLIVNPMGFRPNRGVRPLFVPKICTYLWSCGRVTQLFLRPFLVWYCYSVMTFRVPNGDQGAAALRLVANADFSSQIPIVAELKNRPDVIVVVVYGGSDPLIEMEIHRELVDAFNANPEIVCNADNHESSTASQEFDKLLREGRTKVGVRFEKGNHFLQKFRAVFLADAICAILTRTK